MELRDSIALSSCTAGIHLILHALGIGPDDEVLVPSLTFVATANSVLYTGATPVFVDIVSPEFPLMCLDDAAAKCTKRTRAVILVHYAGYLADQKLWQDFARDRGLMLIEDAAHAAGVPGAGSFGVAAAFSFYGNKNMTTAEGGAVIASEKALCERIRQMRGHGLTAGTFQRHSSATPGYDVTLLGYNYRMDELRAALGLVQLQKLHEWNHKRKVLTEAYRMFLRERTPQIKIPFAQQDGVSAYQYHADRSSRPHSASACNSDAERSGYSDLHSLSGRSPIFFVPGALSRSEAFQNGGDGGM